MDIRKTSTCQWVLATVAMVGMSFPSALSAQSQSGGGDAIAAGGDRQASRNRVLRSTFFKTVNGVFLPLNAAWANAFTDTVVTCPAAVPVHDCGDGGLGAIRIGDGRTGREGQSLRQRRPHAPRRRLLLEHVTQPERVGRRPPP